MMSAACTALEAIIETDLKATLRATPQTPPNTPQAALELLDQEVSSRSAQLQALSSNIADRKAESGRLGAGLSEALRRKADAEFEAVERRLERWVFPGAQGGLFL